MDIAVKLIYGLVESYSIICSLQPIPFLSKVKPIKKLSLSSMPRFPKNSALSIVSAN